MKMLATDVIPSEPLLVGGTVGGLMGGLVGDLVRGAEDGLGGLLGPLLLAAVNKYNQV